MSDVFVAINIREDYRIANGDRVVEVTVGIPLESLTKLIQNRLKLDGKPNLVWAAKIEGPEARVDRFSGNLKIDMPIVLLEE